MTEHTRRELRDVTRLALQRTAQDGSVSWEDRSRARAALARMDHEAKPDLREPYVCRFHVQPGLWLTVDASHNILLEVRSPDESELLAAYALSDALKMKAQLEICKLNRDKADIDACAARKRAADDAEWGRRLAAGMGPGEDADSRAAAVAELLRAGLRARSVAYVLKRAYGHLSGSFSVAGTDQPGTVTYDREHGTYAVREPERATSWALENLPAAVALELGRDADPE
jgi:hypothetical protein